MTSKSKEVIEACESTPVDDRGFSAGDSQTARHGLDMQPFTRSWLPSLTCLSGCATPGMTRPLVALVMSAAILLPAFG